MKRLRLLAVCILSTLSFSCGIRSVGTLMREDLFSLSIGKMEDQIDLFQVDSTPVNLKTRIYLRDGIISIGNGNACKVMQFNSYGDLLSLYYNPDESAKPVILPSDDNRSAVTTRRSFPYHFSQVGEIAVNSRNMLYVEERLPDSRRIFDAAAGAVLNKVVLVFSSSGRQTGYLGQEGLGGSPFPYIDGLYVTDSDEVVVISRTMKNWLIFWYSPAGELLSRAEIPLGNLPIPEGEDIIPFLESIYPAPDDRIAYVKFNYYREAVDPATRKKYRIENLPSRVYSLDMRTGSYKSWIDVPRNLIKPEELDLSDSQEKEYSSQFLGAARGGFFFFMNPKDRNFYELLILGRHGRVVARRNIVIEDNELFLKTFYLSPDGILSALLGKTHGADIVWWRSDKLIRRN